MQFKFLSKYFPPEKFLKPSYIGISFSDTSIKAVYFEKKDGKSLKSAIVSLEKGAIVNGSIVKMDEVVKKLSLIKKDFSLPFVFFAIPDELTYVFPAQVPAVGNDLTESVAFIIEENVPLQLSETVFDFSPVQISQNGSEYTSSIVVAACVKKEVDKFVEAIYKSGFEPLGCIHESQAIALSVIPKKFFGNFAIIHARENRIGIHLTKNKLVHFSTIRNVSSDGDYNAEFLDEYEKFLEYCSKYDISSNQPIKLAFVCGDFESAKKIVEVMSNQKNYSDNVKLSNVWINVFSLGEHPQDIPFEKSLSFAGPIGAVLSEIN